MSPLKSKKKNSRILCLDNYSLHRINSKSLIRINSKSLTTINTKTLTPIGNQQSISSFLSASLLRGGLFIRGLFLLHLHADGHGKYFANKKRSKGHKIWMTSHQSNEWCVGVLLRLVVEIEEVQLKQIKIPQLLYLINTSMNDLYCFFLHLLSSLLPIQLSPEVVPTKVPMLMIGQIHFSPLFLSSRRFPLLPSVSFSFNFEYPQNDRTDKEHNGRL